MNFPGLRAEVRCELSERIVGPDNRSHKLAHEVVAAMEEDLSIRGWPEGHLIGSVSALRQRFGMGRKACQEAITIMQTRRLINVRRGVGGGLYVSRPGLNDTAQALILHLVLSRTSPRVLRDARIAVCHIAIRSLIGRNMPFVYRDWPSIAGNESGSNFHRQLALACGNPTIVFLMDLLEELQRRYVAANPQKLDQAEIHTAPLDNALIEAIRSGDAETACDLIRDRIQTLDMSGVNRPMDQVSFDQITTFLDLKKNSGRLAGLIVEEILKHAVAVSFKLGSEWDIGARYGFTGEVVRPALRMLEDLGIVACCRGRSGGVISTQPRIGTVVRLISSGIASCGISPEQNFELSSQLVIEGVRLAAERNKSAPPSPSKDVPSQKIVNLTDLIDIENTLLDMMDNPILAIFVRSVALQSLLSKRLEDLTHFSGQMALTMHACSLEISRAIRMGETMTAVNAAKHKSELMKHEIMGVS
ncbi:FCD domain-containing protein [Pseudomonas sp. FEN]|uniref:FCD domain-containing protein n=1 Tax=Pseudomonas sp. FEN TaxID=2767468 RepID=UPI00174EBEBD|nr:FCD domain-containing protein [Pseudomonas sp. FEN]